MAIKIPSTAPTSSPPTGEEAGKIAGAWTPEQYAANAQNATSGSSQINVGLGTENYQSYPVITNQPATTAVANMQGVINPPPTTKTVKSTITNSDGSITTTYTDGTTILTPASNGTSTTPDPNAPTSGNLTQTKAALDEITADNQSAYDTYNATISRIYQGDLSQAEQQQLDAVQSQYDSIKQQQAIANQSSQGLAAEFNQRLGLTQGSPLQAQGYIDLAINTGLSRIADIQSKAESVKNQMKQEFLKDDLSAANDSYNAYTKLSDQKSEAIKDLYSMQDKYESDLRTYNLDQQKQEADAKQQEFENQQATEKAALDKIASDRAEKQLQETIRHDKTSESQDQQKIDNDKQASSPTTGDFAATVDLVANMQGTVAQQKAVKEQLQGLIASKDYSSAYNTIANSVENGLTGTTRQKFADARTDLGVMGGLKSVLQAYADAGGDTGLLKGTAEQIERSLGQVTDPKLTSLAVQLQREFQTYRNTMTGAAFGPQESKEYASVNPTTTKNLDLNLATIDGALNQLSNRVESTINSRVPSAQYIKDLASGATTSADPEESFKKARQDPQYKSLIDQAVGQFPDYSPADILEIVGYK